VNVKFTHEVFGISPIYDWAYSKKLKNKRLKNIIFLIK
jgi:hypothetical protein